MILNHENNKQISKENQNKTLGKCLSLFLEKEYLDEKIYCSNCQFHNNFYKQYKLDRLPPVLIISLKRFKYTSMYRAKIDNLINFPIYDLDLSELCEHKLSNELRYKYDLYGIVNHKGQIDNGHYFSYIKTGTDKWTNFDDSELTEKSEEEIISKDAYILIYKLKSDMSKFDYMNIISNINEALLNEKLISSNKAIKSKKICQKNFYANGEPVKTAYGRGYVISGNINNGNNILKIKLSFGIGYLSLNSIEKELSLDSTNSGYIQEKTREYNSNVNNEKTREYNSNVNNKNIKEKKRDSASNKNDSCIFI